MNRWDLLFIVGTTVTLFMPIVIAFVGCGARRKAAQDRAGERRLAEHRMNARLLRLDI